MQLGFSGFVIMRQFPAAPPSPLLLTYMLERREGEERMEQSHLTFSVPLAASAISRAERGRTKEIIVIAGERVGMYIHTHTCWLRLHLQLAKAVNAVYKSQLELGSLWERPLLRRAAMASGAETCAV